MKAVEDGIQVTVAARFERSRQRRTRVPRCCDCTRGAPDYHATRQDYLWQFYLEHLRSIVVLDRRNHYDEQLCPSEPKDHRHLTTDHAHASADGTTFDTHRKPPCTAHCAT